MTKEQVKRILEYAINKINILNPFMCNNIKDGIYKIYFNTNYFNYINDDGKTLKILSKRIRFSRKGYHKFINDNYPSLAQYIIKRDVAWINIYYASKINKEDCYLILESKRQFLTSLLKNYK